MSTKNGLDYFPLDVHLSDEVRLIEAEFGLPGFAIVVKLYQKIYSAGYYLEYSDEVALLFSRDVGMGGSAVSEIVQASIRRGIFDSGLFEKYQVLSSAGIQRRYLEAVKRRQSVPVKKEYLLLDLTLLPKNVYIQGKNVDIERENVDISKQSKVKESKVKESKAEVPSLATAISFYNQNFGLISSVITGDMEEFNQNGLTEDMIIKAMEESLQMNVRNWKYVRSILNRCLKDNIKTAEQFNGRQLEKRKKPSEVAGSEKRKGYSENDMKEVFEKL